MNKNFIKNSSSKILDVKLTKCLKSLCKQRNSKCFLVDELLTEYFCSDEKQMNEENTVTKDDFVNNSSNNYRTL